MKLAERVGNRVVEERKYYIDITPGKDDVPEHIWTTLNGRNIRMTPETLLVTWCRENHGEWQLKWLNIMGRRIHKQCPNQYVFATFYDCGTQVRPLEPWAIPLIPWLGKDIS